MVHPTTQTTHEHDPIATHELRKRHPDLFGIEAATDAAQTQQTSRDRPDAATAALACDEAAACIIMQPLPDRAGYVLQIARHVIAATDFGDAHDALLGQLLTLVQDELETIDD